MPDLEDLQATYDAVKRRTQGAYAYEAIIGQIDFRKWGANAYTVNVAFEIPDYILELLDKRLKLEDKYALELHYIMISNNSRIFTRPSDDLLAWLRRYASPKSNVDQVIDAEYFKVIDANETHILIKTTGRKATTIMSVFTKPLTKQYVKQMLMDLLFIYESAIDNAFDSRKRDDDEGDSGSSAKRAAAST